MPNSAQQKKGKPRSRGIKSHLQVRPLVFAPPADPPTSQNTVPRKCLAQIPVDFSTQTPATSHSLLVADVKGALSKNYGFDDPNFILQSIMYYAPVGSLTGSLKYLPYGMTGSDNGTLTQRPRVGIRIPRNIQVVASGTSLAELAYSPEGKGNLAIGVVYVQVLAWDP